MFGVQNWQDLQNEKVSCVADGASEQFTIISWKMYIFHLVDGFMHEIYTTINWRTAIRSLNKVKIERLPVVRNKLQLFFYRSRTAKLNVINNKCQLNINADWHGLIDRAFR